MGGGGAEHSKYFAATNHCKCFTISGQWEAGILCPGEQIRGCSVVTWVQFVCALCEETHHIHDHINGNPASNDCTLHTKHKFPEEADQWRLVRQGIIHMH